VAVVVEEAADVAAVQAIPWSAGVAQPAVAPAPAAAPAASPAPAAAAVEGGHGSADAVSALPTHRIMPAARALLAAAASHGGASMTQLQPLLSGGGSGKGGRITKTDALAVLGKADAPTPAPAAGAAQHAAAPAPAPAAAAAVAAPTGVAAVSSSAAGWSVGPAPKAPTVSPAEVAAITTAVPPRGKFTDVKASQVRRVIAARLTESKAGVPHAYAVLDCRIDALLALRNTLKAAGVTVSVNDMVVKAAAKALADVPEANCFYDVKTDTVRPNPGVDVSVAVATEGGLITPIVKGADKLGLVGINERVKDLASRARANRLKPEEFQGGSFTISNLGMYGSVDEFSAVINPPQACILAVGKGEKRVVASNPLPVDVGALTAPAASKAGAGSGSGSASASGGGGVEVATVMAVQLSFDGRVVDPGVAGAWLQAFGWYVANPALLVA
jgi:pyruvate dehydrogenase E2 component (dihydrolipoamide acetyltransferase)